MDVNEIVSQVLRSPELRNSLESAVRNINPPQIQNHSTSIRQELSRLFPSINGSSTVTRRTPSRTSKKNENVMFSKDVILLEVSASTTTLRGITKSHAFENGKFYLDA